MSTILFLHGLESNVDDDLVPTGSKARHLAARYGATLVPLDTRRARACLRSGPSTYPFAGYEEAFAIPLARARAALRPETQLIIGSSFGGAVLLRLLHEAPTWTGASIFLAGAGVKLTPHERLPHGPRCHLIHGTSDDLVPLAHSQQLADSSPDATLEVLDDGHRLSRVLDGSLDAAIARLTGLRPLA